MTQRKWETTDGWEVLCGWDRPLQYFFVNIDRECRTCNGTGGLGDEPNDADRCPVCEGSGTEFLFNNISDTQYTDVMGGMTIQQVNTVLDISLTEWPHDVMDVLVADRLNNLGNDVRTWPTQGEGKDAL